MKKFSVFFIILLKFGILNIKASDEPKPPKQINWLFNGVTGKFDRQSIQRGFKVYKEVCSACHSVKRLAFRNLMEIGFSEDEVKALASEYEVKDGPNEEGEMFDRSARLTDMIPGPYPNEKAARAANNGAYPLDLSLIIKARHDGANYVYSLLTGYSTPPKNFELGENMYYNPYFAAGGNQLAMTPPLHTADQVEFNDNTKASIDQMSKDVVNFLQWVAEPEMEDSKSLGIKVIIFLLIFTVLFYIAKKRIWQRIK
ncbi:cytochrome c1 [Rickettsiales endosymbiont of Trichoplax sp. H2]|uniref:cytochrome c1 n=1 Tax=Rickettsiales endosymbiont of Trichoplax sp. H2 TaxID=2021221 RepID=UPI0012B3CF56|nr:cytochrome c1 [Rickettsiales endosymbiont of Trichoplax sp. H2]MSO13238.1 Cytochrome c1, heme protein, mitochondrial [Rickettsiales endosymbiont of Trichoplax sp. H2]